MTNIINFPNNNAYTTEQWERCQKEAKEIASQWVDKTEAVEEYPLALCMAAGFAIDYIKTAFPEIYNDYMPTLCCVLDGVGLKNI